MLNEMQKDIYPVPSVMKAFRMLEIISESGVDMSMSVIVGEVGYPSRVSRKGQVARMPPMFPLWVRIYIKSECSKHGLMLALFGFFF